MGYKYTLAFKLEENPLNQAIRHPRVFLYSPERNRENVIRSEVAQLRMELQKSKKNDWANFSQLTELMITRNDLVKIKEEPERREEKQKKHEEDLEKNLKMKEHTKLFFEFCEIYTVKKTEQEDLLKILLSIKDYMCVEVV